MRERRVMLGLTQQQMADLIGVTYQQAHKCEKGIRQRMLLELARNFLKIPDPRHREAVATLARALAEHNDGSHRTP
jgi:transcriptional regulator with XRE-family HTH domain